MFLTFQSLIYELCYELCVCLTFCYVCVTYELCFWHLGRNVRNFQSAQIFHFFVSYKIVTCDTFEGFSLLYQAKPPYYRPLPGYFFLV